MSESAVLEPQRVTQPKKQPRYNVVLHNDEFHTFIYVIQMMRKLFGHTGEDAKKIATTVHAEGRAICLTTTLEHAELKRDQIRAMGRDDLVENCPGPMKASIEPFLDS